jgi:hypothetical protein
VGGVPDALAAQTVPTAVEAVTTAARERERIGRRTGHLHHGDGGPRCRGLGRGPDGSSARRSGGYEGKSGRIAR